jgi:hypothetical protein
MRTLIAVLLLVILSAQSDSVVGQTAASGPTLEVVGTTFHVTMPDGHVLTSRDLLGVVLDAVDDSGRTITIRIDSVSQDPFDVEGEIWLHHFSVLNTEAGTWGEFCSRAPDGTLAGFPLSGRWTANGQHVREATSFTISCASGATGKCVRFGYKPWRVIGAESLWDYHQTCVRMVRADYGGDGIPHTRDGTLIDIFDRLGIQRSDRDPALTFEAAWGPDGAVCVRHTRVAEKLSIEELVKQYPKLADRLGASCSEAVPALIWNRS